MCSPTTERAVRDLLARVAARNRAQTHEVAIAVAFASNDLELRYKPVIEVDRTRFELWARRALLDADNGLIDGVRSDFVTLEWIRDRIAHSLNPVTRTRLDTLVRDLGGAVADEDAPAASALAEELLSLMDDL